MKLRQRLVCLLAIVAWVGCSRGPQRFRAPKVDTADAAGKAMEQYDANNDGSLTQEELKKCPGMLSHLDAYDRNGNHAVEKDEIAAQLDRLLNRTGGTQLTISVKYKGQPLRDATVIMEPEPYLGETIQTAKGVTNGAGGAEMAIPTEFVPEHLRRLNTVHYGTFKIRITHPTIQIPSKYNTETELGYETEPGKPNVTYDLK